MKTFYVTFTQLDDRRNGVYKLLCTSGDEATLFCNMNKFMKGWSMIYTDNDFEIEFFPQGVLDTYKVSASSTCTMSEKVYENYYNLNNMRIIIV